MLVCVVTVEMIRPGTSCLQRTAWIDQHKAGRELRPAPNGQLRIWKGSSALRDWDRMIAFKQRDGWTLLSFRREFLEDTEIKDQVEQAP